MLPVPLATLFNGDAGGGGREGKVLRATSTDAANHRSPASNTFAPAAGFGSMARSSGSMIWRLR
jgi:hypothetical protein